MRASLERGRRLPPARERRTSSVEDGLGIEALGRRAALRADRAGAARAPASASYGQRTSRRTGVVDGLDARRFEGPAGRDRGRPARARRCRASCRRSSARPRRPRPTARRSRSRPRIGLPAVPAGSPASEARAATDAPAPIFHANATCVASWCSRRNRPRNVFGLRGRGRRRREPEEARGLLPDLAAPSAGRDAPGVAVRRSPRERLLVERAVAGDERLGRELPLGAAAALRRERGSRASASWRRLSGAAGHALDVADGPEKSVASRPRRPRAARRPRCR